MKMKEAFTALLNGECITRSDWDGIYIKYDEIENKIKIYENGRLMRTENGIGFQNFDGQNAIGFHYGVDGILSLWIMDDDENEIWISEEEKKELDAIKWRINKFCYSNLCNPNCMLYNPEKECKIRHISTLDNMSKEMIKNIYNIIKEEE